MKPALTITIASSPDRENLEAEAAHPAGLSIHSQLSLPKFHSNQDRLPEPFLKTIT